MNPDENTEGLTLAQLIGRADLWFKKKLLVALEESDHEGLNSSDIFMLANLNCGRTYPSEIARRIGVSRQAVYKMLKNLELKKIITLEIDSERRNSKVIQITPKGEGLIHDAVGILYSIEDELRSVLPPESIEKLRNILELDWEEPHEG